MFPAGKSGEVFGLATARRRVPQPELEVDRSHGSGDVARLGLLCQLVIHTLDVGDLLRRRLFERGGAKRDEGDELELLDRDPVAGAPGMRRAT